MLAGSSWSQIGKTTVHFYSKDSLLITADDYFESDTLPYIILLHDQESSRGEFREIINRFQKMNLNCLAVDLRNGGNKNFLNNETAKRCRKMGLNKTPEFIENDIDAAINYSIEKSAQKVVLLGSRANGSLALKRTKENENVKAAIALSPGEYYMEFFSLKETIAGIQKPVLVTSSKTELPYIKIMVSEVDDSYLTLFVPEESEGETGINALLSDNKDRAEYWLALMLFFKEL